MIIDSNKHPEKNIYFIGAIQLQLLASNKGKHHDIHSLFHQYNKIAGTQISFDYHILGLDWLFILNAVKIDKEGNIISCI